MCLSQRHPLLASVDTMQARGQTSMLCRIKGRLETLRQSLFWPVTELDRGWGKELHGTLFFFFKSDKRVFD